MIRRESVLALIAFAAASAPLRIRAQSPSIRRIGVLLRLELPKQIADLAKRYRIPTAHQDRRTVAQGALARHGVYFVDGFARTAAFVEKILRGANPGIRITQSVLVRVDEVAA